MNEQEKKPAKIAIGDLWSKTQDIGKKAANGVQKGAKVLAEQTKQTIHDQQIKKYNPLFAKEFKSKNFNLPNIIEIVDDAVRKNIAVCEGAIGWLENHKGVEVLHLYDEFVEKSGLQFSPAPQCNAVYCVDTFDRSRFINSNCVFGKANEQKLAELEHIAYCLGAKSCSIEIVEANTEVETSGGGARLGISKISANRESKSRAGKANKQSGKSTTYFEGNSTSKQPQLKWFAQDENIKGLIEMRCSGNNSIKSKILEIKGSSTATMSRKSACAIDAVLKVKVGAGVSMEREAVKEQSQTLIFEIEF